MKLKIAGISIVLMMLSVTLVINSTEAKLIAVYPVNVTFFSLASNVYAEINFFIYYNAIAIAITKLFDG